jgi:diguanylate cyclase (GGDEF)-like protein/PAS domain S-box-containing protein
MNQASNDTGDSLRIAQKAAVLAAGVGLCCWWSIAFTRGPDGVSTLWAASGLLCGVLLTSPRRCWPAYVGGAFAASVFVNLLNGAGPFLATALSVANVLDASLVSLAVSRYVGDVTDQIHIRRTARIAMASTLVACALSALLAATVLASAREGEFVLLFRSWYLSHVLGMLVFANLVVIAHADGWHTLVTPGRRVELALTIVLLAATCLAIFAPGGYSVTFPVYPVLLLAVFRHGRIGAVVGVAIVAMIATTATVTGNGPFMRIPIAGAVDRMLLLQLFIVTTCLLALPVAIVLTERRMLTRRLAEREHQYRMLSDYSHDLVIRFDADGVRRYISPSVTEMLGWTREDLENPRWDIVHPEDIDRLLKALAELRADGSVSTVQYRVRHKEGHYITIEAHARLVPGQHPGDPPDIIYSGRDVTRRIEAEQALERNQRRLRAITDNLPAFVIHVDTREKYTFANAYTGRVLDVDIETMIGRTVREVMGEKVYAEIKPHMDAAFRGETVTFEIERDFQGRHHHYQSTYVPDVDASGVVQGFYAVTFDISQLKLAERELERLARYDSLTGLANRLHFKERVELAILRHQRSSRPIALLYLDIDHFKQINDSFGHAAGDTVLCEFAQRLGESVRATDFAARLGGDEFVVLIEDIEESDAAETVARKLIARMRECVGPNGQALSVTTSIGIAFCRRTVASPDALMQIADTALYEAKAAGRNTYRMAG